MSNHETGITPSDQTALTRPSSTPTWQTLAEFIIIPDKLDSERMALEKVIEAVQGLNLPATHLERLRTAVAKATVNAIENGNRYQADLPIVVRVLVSQKTSLVRVTDLAGQQPPRGWGFFLIEKIVDNLWATGDDVLHTIELFLYLEGGQPEA